MWEMLQIVLGVLFIGILSIIGLIVCAYFAIVAFIMNGRKAYVKRGDQKYKGNNILPY